MQVIKVCEENDASEIRVAEDDEERALFWKGRKAAFGAMGSISNDYYVQDGVVPRTELGAVLKKIADLSEEYGLRVANVFHAGDGNLHPLVLYDNDAPGEAEKAEDLAADIVFACLEHGGSLTGEHGIGRDKMKYMPQMFTTDDMDVMQLLRCAFDPHRICNPGKIFPTPRLCGERPGPFHMHPIQKAGTRGEFLMQTQNVPTEELQNIVGEEQRQAGLGRRRRRRRRALLRRRTRRRSRRRARS